MKLILILWSIWLNLYEIITALTEVAFYLKLCWCNFFCLSKFRVYFLGCFEYLSSFIPV